MSAKLPDSEVESTTTTASPDEQAKGARTMRITVFVFVALIVLLVGVQMLRS